MRGGQSRLCIPHLRASTSAGRERLLPPRPMLVSQPLLLSTGMVCSGSSPPCPPACDERGKVTISTCLSLGSGMLKSPKHQPSA